MNINTLQVHHSPTIQNDLQAIFYLKYTLYGIRLCLKIFLLFQMEKS